MAYSGVRAVRRRLATILALAVSTFAAAEVVHADGLLHSYEGDVLPQDFPGWVANNCAGFGTCVDSLENGHLVYQLQRQVPSLSVGSIYTSDEATTPPSLWIEWRFHSTNRLQFTPYCDAFFIPRFRLIIVPIYFANDYVFNHSADISYRFPNPDEFHTFRFESSDALNYRFSVDGIPFTSESVASAHEPGVWVHFGSEGGCGSNPNATIFNRWDFVRFGPLSDGELMVAVDPPSGIVEPTDHPELDRFVITFDQPAYVFVPDIAVESTAAEPPAVMFTRRLDNGPADVLEIVLDGPLPIGHTTRFTFDTGGGPQVVEYYYVAVGSCCFDDGACLDLPAADCTDQGGVAGASDACEGDADGDGRDGVCGDACPGDPAKTAPGVCGCGIPDLDSDDDSVADCIDQCPEEDDRIDTNRDDIPDCAQFLGIPTTTPWGLTSLALLLLIAAKVRRLGA